MLCQRCVFLCAMCMLLEVNAQLMLSRLNGAASVNEFNRQYIGQSQNDFESSRQNEQHEPNAWQPITMMHNDWFFLQATTASETDTQQQQQQQQKQRQHQPKPTTQQRQQSPEYKQEHATTNYYAYNHRTRLNNEPQHRNYGQVVSQSGAAITTAQMFASKSIKTQQQQQQQHQQQHHQQHQQQHEEDEAELAEKKAKPYIVAISNGKQQQNLLTRRHLPLRRQQMSDNALTEDVRSRNSDDTFPVSHQLQHHQQKPQHQQQQQQQKHIYKQHTELEETLSMPHAFANKNAATVGITRNPVDDFSAPATDDDRLRSTLVPFERALDEVRNVCDIVKNIISDDNDDSNNDNDDDDANDDERSEIADNLSELAAGQSASPAMASNEVQGRSGASLPSAPTSALASASASASASSASASSTGLSTFAGSGRKVKKLQKKFKKLLLPLLLAYKLKFLTLIPVLIGGLTLLVGTTGLAGFFFALFTAVMSLKSTAPSKSIILKKI